MHDDAKIDELGKGGSGTTTIRRVVEAFERRRGQDAAADPPAGTKETFAELRREHPRHEWRELEQWNVVNQKGLMSYTRAIARELGCGPETWPGRFMDWAGAAAALAATLKAVTIDETACWIAPTPAEWAASHTSRPARG